MFVYGLPGETLLQFEGSGVETDWQLEFPVDANPKGFRSIVDVLITFDTNAYYSDTVAAKQEAASPAERISFHHAGREHGRSERTRHVESGRRRDPNHI